MKDKDTAEFQDMLAALRMLGADPAPGASVGRAMARMQTTGTADGPAGPRCSGWSARTSC